MPDRSSPLVSTRTCSAARAASKTCLKMLANRKPTAQTPVTPLLARFLSTALFTLVAFFPQSVFADTAKQNPFYTIEQLARALVLVENHYVLPVDRSRILEGAIKGMIAELDPHSVFMTREEYKAFRDDTEGSFVGVGVEVDMRDGLLTVLRPIDGSPADRAGLLPGDQVIAVDGWSTRGRQLDQVLQRIRGERGTPVRLHIRRPGVEQPFVVSILRGDVHVRSVVGQRLDGNIAYVIIKQFQRGTHTEFLEVVGSMRLASDAALKGLLLDLRTNPGGLVHESVGVADELLERGVIFSMRSRGRVIDEVSASLGGAVCRLPLVVLVNELTASAAELLAGAIQDHERGLLVGTTTYGKGSVQSVVELPGGEALKLTTALYFTPRGRTIQARGITPSVIVRQPGLESGLPIVRERDTEGHILVPGADETTTERSDVSTSEIVVPREGPSNPVGRGDRALSVAYQLLVDELIP